MTGFLDDFPDWRRRHFEARRLHKGSVPVVEAGRDVGVAALDLDPLLQRLDDLRDVVPVERHQFGQLAFSRVLSDVSVNFSSLDEVLQLLLVHWLIIRALGGAFLNIVIFSPLKYVQLLRAELFDALQQGFSRDRYRSNPNVSLQMSHMKYLHDAVLFDLLPRHETLQLLAGRHGGLGLEHVPPLAGQLHLLLEVVLQALTAAELDVVPVRVPHKGLT